MELNKLIVSDAALNVIDNGAWVTLDSFPDVEVFVTGLGSDDARRFRREFMAANPDETDEQRLESVKDALIEHVLKDWRGITNNGKPELYSKEKARAWIKSRGGESFAMAVIAAASKIDQDADSFVEQATKN